MAGLTQSSGYLQLAPVLLPTTYESGYPMKSRNSVSFY